MPRKNSIVVGITLPLSVYDMLRKETAALGAQTPSSAACTIVYFFLKFKRLPDPRRTLHRPPRSPSRPVKS